MKKYKLYFVMLTVFLLASSCDKFVDIQPKGIIIPTTLEDIRLFLNQSVFSETDVYAFYMDDDLVLASTDIEYMKSSLSKDNGCAFTFDDYITLEGEQDSRYDKLWADLGRANYALNQLEIIDYDNQELYNELRGEALVHRAHDYFMLVNHYAPQYSPETANDPESGVPIVLEYGKTSIDLTRATVQEVYNFIIADLTEAAILLKSKQNLIKWLPNKTAALAYLAKVYLQMGDLVNAKDYATQALNLYSTLLDYRVSDNIGSWGYDFSVWAYVLIPSLPDFRTTHPEVILPKGGYPLAIMDWSTYITVKMEYLSDDLVELFDKDNDIRYAELVDPATNRYKGFDNAYRSMNGVTVPELYLIRAECNARQGNISALGDITTLLTYRHYDGTVPDFSAVSDADEVLEIVLNERRKEMMFHGRRYMDIRRYNTLYNANISISHVDEGGSTVTLTADDPKWTLAFPLNVVSLNPEIKQNPRN